MPVQSKTTTSREEMMLHVAPLNIQFGQNREHGTSPAWPGANPSADLIVGLDKSSLVFLNRWHHGQSSAEHWGDADDALRVWGAKHGTPGPQYLHPWVPKKHAAADQSHHGKGKQLPDQRWVHCKSFLPQMCERVPVTKTWKYGVCFQRLLFFLSKDVVLLLCLWTSTMDAWFRLGSKDLKVWGVFASIDIHLNDRVHILHGWDFGRFQLPVLLKWWWNDILAYLRHSFFKAFHAVWNPNMGAFGIFANDTRVKLDFPIYHMFTWPPAL